MGRVHALARNLRVLSNIGVVPCQRERGRDLVRPGVRECCRPFRTKCHQRPSRESRFTREKLRRGSDLRWTSVRWKESGSYTRRVCARELAEARLLRQSLRRRNRVRHAK